MAVNKRGLVERTRAILFALDIFVASAFLTVVQLLLWPILKVFDPTFYYSHRLLLTFIDYFVVAPFFKVTTRGLENLRKVPGPAVFVCNHQSAVDAFVFGAFDVNFKVTFKNELKFYPGVGSAMLLAGHIPIKRGDKGSGHQVLDQCAAYLRAGVWVHFFPEGTRMLNVASTSPMGPFKAGAFKLAKDCGVPLVPVTISGARSLFPVRGYPALGFGEVTVTVHEPIPTEGRLIDDLMREAHDAIASSLHEYDYPAPAKAAPAPAAEAASPAPGAAAAKKSD